MPISYVLLVTVFYEYLPGINIYHDKSTHCHSSATFLCLFPNVHWPCSFLQIVIFCFQVSIRFRLISSSSDSFLRVLVCAFTFWRPLGGFTDAALLSLSLPLDWPKSPFYQILNQQVWMSCKLIGPSRGWLVRLSSITASSPTSCTKLPAPASRRSGWLIPDRVICLCWSSNEQLNCLVIGFIGFFSVLHEV